jgi:hypothetical protein
MISSAADGEPGPGERMQETLADARALRRALQQAGVDTRVDDLEVAPALQQQAQNVSQDVTALLRALSGAGVEARDIDQLRRLAADIRASDFSGNPDVLAREARQALALVEQLELHLAKAVNSDDPGIRSAVNEEIPEQHREIVADYYRKLGQVDEED